jgi:hypothetical protein
MAASYGAGTDYQLQINDVIRITMVALRGDQLGLCVSHWVVTSKVATPVLGDAAQAFDTAIAAPIKALMAVSASYRGSGASKIWPLPPSNPTWNITGQGAGTVAGDVLPRQTSGLVTLRTALGGRAYRGRKYAPFPGEADNDANGIPLAAYVTRLATWGNVHINFLNTVNGANTAQLTPVIWHRTSHTWTNVVTHSARLYWATQRRRGSFGRVNIDPTL